MQQIDLSYHVEKNESISDLEMIAGVFSKLMRGVCDRTVTKMNEVYHSSDISFHTVCRLAHWLILECIVRQETKFKGTAYVLIESHESRS